MEYCVLRQVAFAMPGSERLRWAVVLGEADGISLLFVGQVNKANSGHLLAFGIENPERQCFEPVSISQFEVHHSDVKGLSTRLGALAENLYHKEFTKLFRLDDWWKDE